MFDLNVNIITNELMCDTTRLLDLFFKLLYFSINRDHM